MTFVIQMLTQNAQDSLVVGLYLLGLVAPAEKFQENQVQEILGLLGSKLQHQSSDVQVEACVALSRVCEMAEDLSQLRPSAQFLLKIASNVGVNTTSVLECLTEIVRVHPELFEQNLDMVKMLIGHLVSDANADGDVKSLALEFVVVLVEADPSPIRKNSNFIE